MNGLLTTTAMWKRFQAAISACEADASFLRSEADALLNGDRLSVVDKTIAVPGAGPHDYVSQAPYWWPDPSKPDGLPYIRRDGEENPEIHRTDRARLERFREAVNCLILQSFVSSDRTYEEHAGRLLRVWFLDPDTSVNPHLRFAQFIPGICEGRGIGLIDTHSLCFLLDQVGHLTFSMTWTPDDLAGLKKWFEAYLKWFLESEPGRKESGEFNNHGTWYDAQVVCFAMFCGDKEMARQQLLEKALPRLVSQIQPEGSQPHEMARTLSYSYCTFNLTGFAVLAQAARHLDFDLWNWRDPAGRGILPALRWMKPYFLNEKSWEGQQLKPFLPSSAAFLLSLAADGTNDPEWEDARDKVAGHSWNLASNWRTSVRTIIR